MSLEDIKATFQTALQKLMDLITGHHTTLGIEFFQLNNNILAGTGQYLTIDVSKLQYFYLNKRGNKPGCIETNMEHYDKCRIGIDTMEMMKLK